MDPEKPFRRYHIKLPHWRARGAVYFVTWRVKPGVRALSPEERLVVSNAIRHFDGERYAVLAFVVMDDHVHVLVQPYDPWRLEHLLHSWKSYTAKAVLRARGESGSLWQGESFDRIVRDEQELRQKAEYILWNPFKRWPQLEEYAWMGGSFAAASELDGVRHASRSSGPEALTY